MTVPPSAAQIEARIDQDTLHALMRAGAAPEGAAVESAVLEEAAS